MLKNNTLRKKMDYFRGVILDSQPMEKIKIADNKHYSLYVTPSSNRAYLTILGYWRNEAAVPEYLADWKKALSLLQEGFTLLTDASEMKTHPNDVKLLHEQAQLLVKTMNVSKVAEIVKDTIAEMQLDALARTTKFPKRSFTDRAEAEKWLDESL
jgi:hypothetical protein